MDIYEKAKELGVMISESEEFMGLRKSEEELMKNQEAMDLLNEFGTMRQEYAEALSKTKDESSLADMKEKFLSKNDMILNNPIAKNYIDTKTKVDNIFKTVSDILLKEVNGDQGESGAQEKGGCATESGCSGCSGGCS